MPAALIKTLEDWNARMCGCCEMPWCYAPSLTCVSLSVSTNVGSPYYDDAGIPHLTRKAFSNRGPAGPITYSDTSYTLYRLDGSGNILVSTVTGPLFVYQSESRTDTRTETSRIQPAIRTYGCAAYPEQTTTVTREGTYTRSYVGTGGYANPVVGAPSNKFTHTDSDITESVTAVANVWSLTTTTMASTIEDVEPLVFGSTTTVATTVPGLFTTFVENTIPREFADPIPLDAAKTAAMAAIAAENLFEGTCPGNGGYRSNVCESSYAQTVRPIAGYGNFLTGASASKVRYQWTIPSYHLGSYFKITWDVVTDPTDAAIAPTLEKDLTCVWTGPGTGDSNDPSWLSGFYYLDPPDVPGVKRVVNIRYECYRSKFGQKPRLTGEEYVLPAATPPASNPGDTGNAGSTGNTGNPGN